VEKRDGLEIVVRPRLVGRTPHDFRRSAACNLIRAGVAQHVVMQLCGWKTDAMFRRYAIVDERDLRDAVARLAIISHPTSTQAEPYSASASASRRRFSSAS
jgi:integrase